MLGINTLLLRYKNFILFFGIAFVAFFVTSKLHTFSSRRIKSHTETITEVRKKIEVAQKVRFREREIARLEAKFIEDDSFAFINRVSNDIKKVGLTTISLRPARHPPHIFGSGPEGVIKPIALQLVALGQFSDLLKFLEKIDKSDLNILVSSLKMQSVPEGIRADIEIIGLALKQR